MPSVSERDMPTLRVLMAVPKYPFPIAGGLERQSHELARALVRRGNIIHALSTRFSGEQKNEETVDGVRAHRLKWFDSKIARFLFFPIGLARILIRLRPDVDLVHVHNISWFGAFVTLFARVLGLQVITKLPSFGEFGLGEMRYRMLGFLRVALLKCSNAIIAITPESLNELAEVGYPLSRVLKVMNGIEVNAMPPAIPRSNTVIVVFVGRLSREKGLMDLLLAWRRVQAVASVPATLRLIGDGPLANNLRALADRLQLNQTVEFAGHVLDVAAELNRADLFVLPSHAEGNSNAILEAMRAGLPIIATKIGGAPIQVGAEGKNFLVPVRDSETLATRLCELISNESLRSRLGRAMRFRVEHLFSMERITMTYEQAYRLMLSGNAHQLGHINPDLFGRQTDESGQV